VIRQGAEALGARAKALVFISHDGRDADLAEAFGNLLTDVSGGTLRSFRSSDKKGTSGIEFGTEWYSAIMSQLDQATDVVALLTAQSISRPWILYETGVAKGKLDTRVLGVALGVPLKEVTSGPFGQFQNCADDEDSLAKLMLQLMRRIPEATPREEAVRRQVRAFLESKEELLKQSSSAQPAATEEGNSAKLFEEVKVMLQELSDRVERGPMRRSGLRRLRRFHPMMLEELFFHSEPGESPEAQAAAWLMTLSLIRDDVPWVYEVGMELYRAMRSKDPEGIARAREDLERALRFTRGPWLHEIARPDDEETYMLMRHLPEMLERVLSSIPEGEGKRPRIRPNASAQTGKGKSA
jgi:hypothetical protein